jgi:LacI family transcriptional regulator
MVDAPRRKRSPRFLEIAAEAGVSLATVDRVLNERGSVSDKARAKVIAAASKLGVPRVLPSVGHKLVHFDLLLPDSRTPFFLRLGKSFEESARFLDKRFVLHRRIIREDREDLLTRAMLEPSYPRQGLVVAIPDTPSIRETLRIVVGRGEAVVGVVTNMASIDGFAYVGINNYRAGRTAGLILGRFARKSGRVMFLSVGDKWNAHLDRVAGCRDILACDSAPWTTHDDDTRCYEAVTTALRTTGLAGLYNSGAGSAGIVKALNQYDPDHEVVWITHELSDDHRQYLKSGTLTMVIDQDPDMQAISALRYLVRSAEADGERQAPGEQECEFRVYFSENFAEGAYIR